MPEWSLKTVLILKDFCDLRAFANTTFLVLTLFKLHCFLTPERLVWKGVWRRSLIVWIIISILWGWMFLNGLAQRGIFARFPPSACRAINSWTLSLGIWMYLFTIFLIWITSPVQLHLMELKMCWHICLLKISCK